MFKKPNKIDQNEELDWFGSGKDLLESARECDIEPMGFISHEVRVSCFDCMCCNIDWLPCHTAVKFTVKLPSMGQITIHQFSRNSYQRLRGYYITLNFIQSPLWPVHCFGV